MNAIILLADGFETVEALQTYDVLKRAHAFDVRLVSISSSLEVVSSHKVKVTAEERLSDIDVDAVDFLVLPGGELGVSNLKASAAVKALVSKFLDEGKDVHAICAAPSILGELGYLDGLPYTCFPGFQTGKGTWVDAPCVETPQIITGRSMGHTLAFARAIVKKYCGEEGLEAIKPGIDGLEG